MGNRHERKVQLPPNLDDGSRKEQPTSESQKLGIYQLHLFHLASSTPPNNELVTLCYQSILDE